MFSKDSWTSAEGTGAKSWPLQAAQPGPRSVYILPKAQVDKTPRIPLVYRAGCHSSHKGTFVYGWILNYFCMEGEQKMRDILFHHDVDDSKILLSFIEKFSDNCNNIKFIKYLHFFKSGDFSEIRASAQYLYALPL